MTLLNERQKTKVIFDTEFETIDIDCFIKSFSAKVITLSILPSQKYSFEDLTLQSELVVKIFTPRGILIFASNPQKILSTKEIVIDNNEADAKLEDIRTTPRYQTDSPMTVFRPLLGNVDARLVDLPGYGYAKVSAGEKRRWADLMEAYFSTNRNIALVVQLVDMRRKPSELDLDMIDYLEQMNFPFVLALTKSDKLNKTEYKKRLESLEEELAFLDNKPDMIPVSSLNGDGIEQLKNYISLKVEGEQNVY